MEKRAVLTTADNALALDAAQAVLGMRSMHHDARVTVEPRAVPTPGFAVCLLLARPDEALFAAAAEVTKAAWLEAMREADKGDRR